MTPAAPQTPRTLLNPPAGDDTLPRPGEGRERRGALWIAAIAGALVLVLGIALSHLLAGSESARLRDQAEARAQAVLAGRMERVDTWLLSRTQSLRAVAGEDALRIIATELATARAAGKQAAVSSELIFLRLALERQADAFDATGVTLLHPDGQAWLVVGQSGPDLSMMPAGPVDRVAGNGQPVIAQAGGADTPAVDVLVPVSSLQDEGSVVAVMAGRFPIAGLIEILEKPDPLAMAGETVSVVWPDGATGANDAEAAAGTEAGDGESLVLTRRPEGLAWGVRYSRPWEAILSDSRATLMAGYLVSAAAGVAVVMLILGVAWRQGTLSNRKLAEQYQSFASRMESERNLLDTVIDGITEYLFVTDGSGRLRHANAAARELVGLPLDALVGRTLADVLDDSDTATLLLAKVPEGRLSRPMECTLAGESRWVMVLRNPLSRNDPDDDRWVVLVQDMTDLVQERLRTETLQRAVIRTLGRTVAAADPYLADQAARMERVALLLADEMGLSDDERLTLELTSQVSQIGKLFVPRDLLTKAERLTPEEREVIKGHIGHACTLLDDLDPSLPISETLTEITERLDGSGYPNGLRGQEISLPGRILAVADVFTARTAERAYRPGAMPGDILDILKKLPDRYDPEVVQVLAGIVESGRY